MIFKGGHEIKGVLKKTTLKYSKFSKPYCDSKVNPVNLHNRQKALTIILDNLINLFARQNHPLILRMVTEAVHQPQELNLHGHLGRPHLLRLRRHTTRTPPITVAIPHQVVEKRVERCG